MHGIFHDIGMMNIDKLIKVAILHPKLIFCIHNELCKTIFGFDEIKDSDHPDYERKITILALVCADGNIDSWIRYMKTPNDILMFVCAKSNFTKILRSSSEKSLSFTRNNIFDLSFQNTKFLTTVEKANIISFIDTCDPSKLELFGSSTKNNFMSKFWKIIFNELHVLKKIHKLLYAVGKPEKIIKYPVVLYIVFRFFNPCGHIPSKEYMKKNPKFNRVEMVITNTRKLIDVSWLDVIIQVSETDMKAQLDIEKIDFTRKNITRKRSKSF